MTCRELAGFLDQYLDGGLPRATRLYFRLHLSLCRDCRRYLRGYQQTVRSAREAFVEAPKAGGDPTMPEALVRAILAARPDRGDREGGRSTKVAGP